MLELADDLRSWVGPQTGPIDGNGFQQQFKGRLDVLREKAACDHGETDSWLDKLPSDGRSVVTIAEALERVARRLP